MILFVPLLLLKEQPENSLEKDEQKGENLLRLYQPSPFSTEISDPAFHGIAPTQRSTGIGHSIVRTRPSTTAHLERSGRPAKVIAARRILGQVDAQGDQVRAVVALVEFHLAFVLRQPRAVDEVGEAEDRLVEGVASGRRAVGDADLDEVPVDPFAVSERCPTAVGAGVCSQTDVRRGFARSGDSYRSGWDGRAGWIDGGITGGGWRRARWSRGDGDGWA